MTSFACNVIPSRQPPGTVPHLHGSTQALHLYFKEAFLAPLPKLLSKLFPIVCVSLSCFFPLALTYYIYLHTHRQIQKQTHSCTDTLRHRHTDKHKDICTKSHTRIDTLRHTHTRWGPMQHSISGNLISKKPRPKVKKN